MISIDFDGKAVAGEWERTIALWTLKFARLRLQRRRRGLRLLLPAPRLATRAISARCSGVSAFARAVHPSDRLCGHILCPAYRLPPLPRRRRAHDLDGVADHIGGAFFILEPRDILRAVRRRSLPRQPQRARNQYLAQRI